MSRVITGAFALLLITFGSLASACGDNGDELTLEDYLMRVEVLIDDVAERRANSQDPFVEADESAESVEERGETQANFFADFGESVGDFSDDLAALHPPKEAQAAHIALVEASRAFAENAAEVVARFKNATSEADIEDAFSLLDDGGDPEEACNGLQDIADEYEILVTLNCQLQ